MRTSLNETKQIDDHILGYQNAPDALLFEANMILNAQLRNKVALQREVYQAVKQYGRKSMKAELEAIHQKLLAEPEHQGFMQKIKGLFFKR